MAPEQVTLSMAFPCCHVSQFPSTVSLFRSIARPRHHPSLARQFQTIVGRSRQMRLASGKDDLLLYSGEVLACTMRRRPKDRKNAHDRSALVLLAAVISCLEVLANCVLTSSVQNSVGKASALSPSLRSSKRRSRRAWTSVFRCRGVGMMPYIP